MTASLDPIVLKEIQRSNYERLRNLRYYWSNREKVLEKRKLRYPFFRAKYNAKKQEYYQRNRTKCIERRHRKREWVKWQRRKFTLKKEKPRTEQGLWARRVLYSHKQLGDTILIGTEELERIALKSANCRICGRAVSYKKGGVGSASKATLDRIDNAKALTSESVWILCSLCNMMKSNRSMPDFVTYCEMVVGRFPHL
jgi:hypothetical protein